ncbi:hypothetical protein M9991_07945 [Chryseobacterium gallinarum]|uniref:hypothetical protein n=1 Tax=Chryseobacterium gallinarum TaxID=1324352 RepID=UPI002023CDAB|nr:hypothetical protein [Chryseobacterium gallinarum]MCL8536800.1 hypothetical protein [Chryseobacterium gallinarum]
MKNFIVLICLLFSYTLLIAQNKSYFSFDRDTIRAGDTLTGYYYKLHHVKDKDCFNKHSKFLFKFKKNYLINAEVISENKCFTPETPMVRFLFKTDKIFNDKVLNKGNFNIEVIYYDTKPKFLYKNKVGNIILVK